MSNRQMICIACPIGCHLEVEELKNGKTIYQVSGNKCPRGEAYAIGEITNPSRMVTSTVIFKNGRLGRLPVRTSKAIPKDKIFECMKLLQTLEVEGPIKAGEVIYKNLLDLDVDIIATRSM